MVELTEIKKVIDEFGGDISKIESKIKSVQSQKCRLKKLKRTANYEQEMTDILKLEQVLKEAKATLVPKKKFVTNFTQADIDVLDFDETRKAIKSIQSKKCLSQQYDDQKGYDQAVAIENMLQEHLNTVKPVDNSYVRRSDLNTIIDTIENDITITTEQILELLKDL